MPKPKWNSSGRECEVIERDSRAYHIDKVKVGRAGQEAFELRRVEYLMGTGMIYPLIEVFSTRERALEKLEEVEKQILDKQQKAV